MAKKLSNIDVTGDIEATAFVVTDGTSSQFLKADGSIDSSVYATAGASGLAFLGSIKYLASSTSLLSSVLSNYPTAKALRVRAMGAGGAGGGAAVTAAGQVAIGRGGTGGNYSQSFIMIDDQLALSSSTDLVVGAGGAGAAGASGTDGGESSFSAFFPGVIRHCSNEDSNLPSALYSFEGVSLPIKVYSYEVTDSDYLPELGSLVSVDGAADDDFNVNKRFVFAVDQSSNLFYVGEISSAVNETNVYGDLTIFYNMSVGGNAGLSGSASSTFPYYASPSIPNSGFNESADNSSKVYGNEVNQIGSPSLLGFAISSGLCVQAGGGASVMGQPTSPGVFSAANGSHNFEHDSLGYLYGVGGPGGLNASGQSVTRSGANGGSGVVIVEVWG